MKTVQPTQLTLDKTLARIRRQFAQEAWRDWSQVFALHDKIRDCIERGEDSRRFNRAHELLQSGLSQWLNDLAHEAEACFRTMFDIAVARPDWVSDDPVQWARAQINRFLTEEFEQGAQREDKQWVGPTPLVEHAELKFKPARHLDWFRRACDGPPNVNLLPGSTGWREPWRAPHWVRQSKRQIAGWMVLPVEVTNSLIWLAQSDFKRQLNSMLDQAEEAAYIHLARRPSDQIEKPTDKGAFLAGTKQSDSREPSVAEVAPGTAEVKMLVDTLATPAAGARVAKAALRKKGLPYRPVKDYQRIVEAVEYKKKMGCTFPQASEAIFGNRRMASKIAYHYRKLKGVKQ